MRIVQNLQLQFGQVDISRIQFDAKSRDDIPQILKGLQYLYINREIREEIFSLLEKYIAPKINKKNGRPGMVLWKILVLGVLRLDLNCDYDRLQELANHHDTIRQMLGHGDWDDKEEYPIQTLKDNVSLLTPELLDEINQVVVSGGHALVKKKESEVLGGRCDSFVVETNVHYPTDINLLYDAMSKIITLVAELCKSYQISNWRQSTYNIKQVKKLMRTAQHKKRARGKTEAQKKRCAHELRKAHQEYINASQGYLAKACSTLEKLEKQGLNSLVDSLRIENIKGFIVHAERQINQINRRILQGEVIAHSEKVFSIFEPHTEWICKGKAGVSQELGLKVCVMEDHYQFILHHRVMEKETDEHIAIEMVKETQQRFPDLKASSFDKGFHSQKNQTVLNTQLKLLALPRKGKLSQQARAIEHAEEFQQARRKHAAVESAIHALEVHGLDRCLDRGMTGFKRYVALAIVARNIQIIGAYLQKREQKRLMRKRKKCACVNAMFKLAA